MVEQPFPQPTLKRVKTLVKQEPEKPDGIFSRVVATMWNPPLLASGAVGGPIVIYAVTPMRNALTLAADDSKSSYVQLYRKIFKDGIRKGWTGGQIMMPAAVPQFCILGPFFHVWRDLLGGSAAAAILATGTSETLIAFGSETRNAQMAIGKQGTLHNPLIPFGPGVIYHVARNAVAMSGLRVMSAPCPHLSEGLPIPMTLHAREISSDLMANLIASALSMPLHQLYSFSVISAARGDLKGASLGKQAQMAGQFLRKQFFIEGTLIPSKLAARDVALRCTYNASIFTVYGFIERGFIRMWEQAT